MHEHLMFFLRKNYEESYQECRTSPWTKSLPDETCNAHPFPIFRNGALEVHERHWDREEMRGFKMN